MTISTYNIRGIVLFSLNLKNYIYHRYSLVYVILHYHLYHQYIHFQVFSKVMTSSNTFIRSNYTICVFPLRIHQSRSFLILAVKFRNFLCLYSYTYSQKWSQVWWNTVGNTCKCAIIVKLVSGIMFKLAENKTVIYTNTWIL